MPGFKPPVTVEAYGVTYPSIEKCAKAVGLNPSQVGRAVRRGESIETAIARAEKWRESRRKPQPKYAKYTIDERDRPSWFPSVPGWGFRL